jgi:hypothetical protein
VTGPVPGIPSYGIVSSYVARFLNILVFMNDPARKDYPWYCNLVGRPRYVIFEYFFVLSRRCASVAFKNW